MNMYCNVHTYMYIIVFLVQTLCLSKIEIAIPVNTTLLGLLTVTLSQVNDSYIHCVALWLPHTVSAGGVERAVTSCDQCTCQRQGGHGGHTPQ